MEPDQDPNDLVQGDKKLEFRYDYVGWRVEKKVYTHNGSSWDLSTTRRFMYHNWLPLLELDVTNPGDPNETVTIPRKYTWGLDWAGQGGGQSSALSALEGAGGTLDRPPARQGQVGGLLATYDADSSKSYIYFHDATLDTPDWAKPKGRVPARLAARGAACQGPASNVGQLIDRSDGSTDGGDAWPAIPSCRSSACAEWLHVDSTRA